MAAAFSTGSSPSSKVRVWLRTMRRASALNSNTMKGSLSSSSALLKHQKKADASKAEALLEGKALYHSYIYNPDGWDQAKAAKYYRADLSANVWWPSELPEELLQKYYAKT